MRIVHIFIHSVAFTCIYTWPDLAGSITCHTQDLMILGIHQQFPSHLFSLVELHGVLIHFLSG
jgi:hypothetical protein